MFITKDKHDQMVSELEQIKASSETATADLASAQAEVTRLTEQATGHEEEIVRLTSENETLKTENETLKAAQEENDPKVKDLDAQLEAATKLVTELSSLKNDWKPAARASGDGKKPDGAVDLDRVQEVIKIQNQK